MDSHRGNKLEGAASSVRMCRLRGCSFFLMRFLKQKDTHYGITNIQNFTLFVM